MPTIKPSEALQIDSEFLTRRPKDCYWTLYVPQPDGSVKEFVAVDWMARSRFGEVRNAVILDANGQPDHDRPIAEFTPGVAAVVWGFDPINHNEPKIALLSQELGAANDPRDPFSKAPILFAEVPAGYRDKHESNRDAAVREALEESGALTVLSVQDCQFPFVIASPTFQANWIYFCFVEVDLAEALGKPDAEDHIRKVEFVGVSDLLRMIREGDSRLGLFRDTFALGILMMFFASNPQFWPTMQAS